MLSDQNSNQVLEKFALAIITEQRRKRRWGIFFKLVSLLIILFFIWGVFPWGSITLPTNLTGLKKNQVARIALYGEINAQNGVTAEDVMNALNNAANNENIRAIILDINSPGGSRVQASYIYNEVRRLQKIHPNLEIDSVCEDLCASAAYYVASSSKNIYANPTSLVGSIGVLMNGFGFVDTLKKLGITRRLYTAGKYKGLLDPFSPENPQSLEFVQKMLDSDHQVFINDVKAGRTNRLSHDENLFTGLVWTGAEAKSLGLIDGFGSVADIARNRYQTEDIIDFTIRKSFFKQMTSHFNSSFWHEFKTTFFTQSLSFASKFFNME